jgi:hypothetical protein
MSLNKSLKHARTARRHNAKALQQELLIVVFGIALLIALIASL